MDKALDVDIFYNEFTFPNSVWHTNNSIYDVNVHHKGKIVGMVSFSKGNTRWWAEEHKNEIWKDWTPSFTDNEDLLLYKMQQRKKLISRIMQKAQEIKTNNTYCDCSNIISTIYSS